MDKGSTVTVINSKIIKEIGTISSVVNVSLTGIGDVKTFTYANTKANLKIKCDSGILPLENVLIVENLGLPIQCISTDLTNVCKNETGINIDPYNEAPELLIGQIHCHLILTREYYELNKYNLIVSRCLLGWAFHSQYDATSRMQVNAIQIDQTNKSNTETDDKKDYLDKQVKSYFDL